ncbi:MAG: DUF5723 family protein [Flavobacteriaceae bacterium]|nr:DUF5723 family protein [Flavobacteriaceae bacterium]
MYKFKFQILRNIKLARPLIHRLSSSLLPIIANLVFRKFCFPQLLCTQKTQKNRLIKENRLQLKNWINLAALLVFFVGSGQVNYTTYFLKNNPAKNTFNPALYKTNNFVKHFSSQSTLQINTNLNYTDLVEKGSGELADSLVLNIDRFTSNIHHIGYVDLNTEFSFFQVGFGVNSKRVVLRKKTPRYVEFSLKKKNYASVDVNKNYLLLLTKGNAPFFEEDFSTGHAGINLSSYMELGVTHSRPLLENLVVGLRLKILFGLLNFNTKTFEFGFKGQSKDNVFSTSADVHIQMSGPIDVTLNADAFFESVLFGSVPIPFQFNNPGIAFDFGVVYDFSPKLRFAASVNDIGKIWWTHETKQLAVHTNDQFEPFDLGLLIDNENNDSIEKWLNETANQLKDSYRLTKSFGAYSENLPFTLNTSLQYELNPFFDVGLLLSHRIAQNFKYSNLLLSANFGIYDDFSLSPVLVLQKRGYFIGCSTLFRIDALQFSLALNDLQGIVNPAKAKGLGGLFGISYVFPLKKKGRGGRYSS